MAYIKKITVCKKGTAWLGVLIGLCKKFVLEVMGGAGAFWGCSEAFNYRDPQKNNGLWSLIALYAFAAFAVLFSLRMFYDICRPLSLSESRELANVSAGGIFLEGMDNPFPVMNALINGVNEDDARSPLTPDLEG